MEKIGDENKKRRQPHSISSISWNIVSTFNNDSTRKNGVHIVNAKRFSLVLELCRTRSFHVHEVLTESNGTTTGSR